MMLFLVQYVLIHIIFCECPYEKHPYPLCHSNLCRSRLWSLIHLEEFAFTDFIISKMATDGLPWNNSAHDLPHR